MSGFLPEGFWYDDENRVARTCPQCGEETYAPGPSGWASGYWKHVATDEYACRRELALRLDDGTIIRDVGWRCVADVICSFHGFFVNRVYGVIVDAETLVQVHPPVCSVDGTGTQTD